MATYDELYTLRGDGPLQKKISVALAVSIDGIRTEAGSTNGHASRVTWAGEALGNIFGESKKALFAVLAANKGSTVAQIKSASDSTVQSNVDAVINILAGVPNV